MRKETVIYRQSFGTDEEFERLLFKTQPETLKIDGETVSELFLLPCSVVRKGVRYPFKYIFAAATEESQRKKGYMEALLKRVIAQNSSLILRPANEELVKYYKRFGFKEFTATDEENADFFIEPEGGFKELAAKEGKTADSEFTLMAINSPLVLSGVSFPFTMP